MHPALGYGAPAPDLELTLSAPSAGTDSGVLTASWTVTNRGRTAVTLETIYSGDDRAFLTGHDQAVGESTGSDGFGAGTTAELWPGQSVGGEVTAEVSDCGDTSRDPAVRAPAGTYRLTYALGVRSVQTGAGPAVQRRDPAWWVTSKPFSLL